MRRFNAFVLTAVFTLMMVSAVFSNEGRVNLPIDGSPYLGSADAPVTVIWFIDYQ